MKPLIFNSNHHSVINLAIPKEKLQTLMHQGLLHPEDFHCLDQHSKKSVWAMLCSLAARCL